MQPFDFQLRTRVVFGPGELNRLGELTSELGKRVLLVSDPGIVAAGHVQRGMDSLQSAGLEVQLYDGARENPTTDNIDDGLAVAKEFEPQVIVGLGGGSSMDCAKGINFVYTNGGTMHDFHGVGRATQPMLPMVAVPTTSGTGSEMQSFALISDAKTHVKMACGDKKASCRIAILDPELTLTQPTAVTALTGVDAISHAIETYVTKRRNPISLHYSREAWRLLAGNFETVLNNPDDLEARSAMQLGAAYSGVAIENSMLGAAHALANPLTATYGIAHGQAVGMMLPHVVRFNGVDYDPWYQELLTAGAGIAGMPDSSTGAEGLASFLTKLVMAAGLNIKLDQSGVENEKIGVLAEAASQQWTGTFNPRVVDQSSLQSIYQNAF
jgi:alcohol dehydrogenase